MARDFHVFDERTASVCGVSNAHSCLPVPRELPLPTARNSTDSPQLRESKPLDSGSATARVMPPPLMDDWKHTARALQRTAMANKLVVRVQEPARMQVQVIRRLNESSKRQRSEQPECSNRASKVAKQHVVEAPAVC